MAALMMISSSIGGGLAASRSLKRRTPRRAGIVGVGMVIGQSVDGMLLIGSCSCLLLSSISWSVRYRQAGRRRPGGHERATVHVGLMSVHGLCSMAVHARMLWPVSATRAGSLYIVVLSPVASRRRHGMSRNLDGVMMDGDIPDCCLRLPAGRVKGVDRIGRQSAGTAWLAHGWSNLTP